MRVHKLAELQANVFCLPLPFVLAKIVDVLYRDFLEHLENQFFKAGRFPYPLSQVSEVQNDLEYAYLTPMTEPS